jgi:hypothetical protein
MRSRDTLDRGLLLLLLVIFIQVAPPVMEIANASSTREPDSVFGIMLEPITWWSQRVDLQKGLLIQGEFSASTDGSLYPGDEQKYDNWAPIRIEFFILSEENYLLFIENEAVSANFIIEDASAGSWQFEIPSTGTWYLVYRNPTIYMVSVQGRFAIVNAGSIALLVVGGAASAILIAALLILYRRH